jgi:HAD superfamily hydrolase (TIGR01509 family)
MRFSAVLLDLGQTLLDYGPAARWPEFRVRRMIELYPLATRLWGVMCFSAEEFGEAVGAGVQTDQMREMEHGGLSVHFHERLRAALTGVGIAASDGALQRMTDAFIEPIREWPKPFAETQSALEQLSSHGVKLAIITNAPWDTPSEPLYSDLGRWGLRRFFSAFVGSGEVPWRKPDPEFMWAAAGELGVPPEHCLVVGDNLMADIAGAGAAGMKSVWINRDQGSAPEDGRWSDRVAKPRPDWVAASLTEVVRIVGAG